MTSLHSGGVDLAEPGQDRAQVQVAYRASGEAAELQVHQPVVVGNGDRRAGDGGEQARTDQGAGLDPV